MSDEEVEDAQDKGQAFIIVNLILRTIFAQAMNMLFGSIMVIQILAHLPLADIMLPANALQQFDLMIGVVSFDYFQPTAYFDLGFSEMPSWSVNFEWLGYDSINFVEGLGSIVIFAAWFLIQFIISLLVTKLTFCCKCAKKKFAIKSVASDFLEFIHGTFFEIMVCVSVSMAMLEYRDYFTDADTFSVTLQFVFTVILAAYICFVFYFTAFKATKWQVKKSSDLVDKKKEKQELA